MATAIDLSLVLDGDLHAELVPPRGDFQVALAWSAALGFSRFSRGCPSALKQAPFLDIRVRRASLPVVRFVAVAVAVNDDRGTGLP